jgi:MoxR-like ATPase
MLVLLVDDCPVPVDVHSRDWILARIRAFRLDAALAAGASPDATVALALRAQMLERMPVRRDLARTARRIVAAAVGGPAGDRLQVPVCRDRVRDCAEELEDLTRRLLAAGPVSARGVAQARALLADGASPIYHRASRDDLRARVLAATEALTPA